MVFVTDRLGLDATGSNPFKPLLARCSKGPFRNSLQGNELHVWMTSHDFIAMVGTDHCSSPDPLQLACASGGVCFFFGE
jgi:hypothetical protein